MLKKELLQLIENIDDEGSVDEVLSKSDLAKSLLSSGLTLDAFKEKMKEKDFKAFMDSSNDKYFQKALETWKSNNLEKELEPFIQDKYPDLVTDPLKKEAIEAKKEIEKLKAEMAKKDLVNEAIKYANEIRVPASFVERFLGEDLEKTKENLDSLKSEMSTHLESLVDERLKANTWIPGGSGDDTHSKSLGATLAEEKNNSNADPGVNPWAK